MSFSKDFLWGGATAANQYEGGWDLGEKGAAVQTVVLVVLEHNQEK